MSAARKLAMSLIATTLFLVALESVLRVTIPADRLKFSWESDDPTIVIDDHGGLLIPPNTERRQHDGTREWVSRTNSIGLREDAEIPEARPPDSYRMLALGDSWMFGWSADQGWSLPAQLEVVLPEKIGGRDVEVINAGVFGTCAFDMLRRWRQYQDVFEVDALLIGTPHNMTRQQSLMEKRTGWYDAVRGAPFIELRLYLVLRRLIAPYTRPQYPRDDSGETFQSSVHDLTVLIQEAGERGVDSWFVLMPTQLTDGVRAREVNAKKWQEAMAPSGAKFAGHVLAQRSCWGDEDIRHASGAGYRAIAEVVSDAIAADASDDGMRSEPDCDGLPGYGHGKR